jgi:polyisoprenoid-binding protein YceI
MQTLSLSKNQGALMKKTLFAGLLAVAAGAASAATYTIDSHHANARFAIDHFGATTNTGGFYNLTGTVAFDPKAQTGSVDVRIPVSSLNTGNARFDEHLKSADLFNAAQYPEMRFQSSKWHFKGNKVSSVEGTAHPARPNPPGNTQSHQVQLLQQPDAENRSVRRRF